MTSRLLETEEQKELTSCMHDDRPMTRKYARIERERRFELDCLPSSVDESEFVRLRDLYVRDTTLRLRRVEDPSGNCLVVKLGQKRKDPDAPDDPRRRVMTTLYMDEMEANAIQFEGLNTVKRRYKLLEQGWTFCIDVWEYPEDASGTILAEVECPTDAELDAITIPVWARREVTEDPAFSGIALAVR